MGAHGLPWTLVRHEHDGNAFAAIKAVCTPTHMRLMILLQRMVLR
jgi:hypothetical protein